MCGGHSWGSGPSPVPTGCRDKPELTLAPGCERGAAVAQPLGQEAQDPFLGTEDDTQSCTCSATTPSCGANRPLEPWIPRRSFLTGELHSTKKYLSCSCRARVRAGQSLLFLVRWVVDYKMLAILSAGCVPGVLGEQRLPAGICCHQGRKVRGKLQAPPQSIHESGSTGPLVGLPTCAGCGAQGALPAESRGPRMRGQELCTAWTMTSISQVRKLRPRR